MRIRFQRTSCLCLVFGQKKYHKHSYPNDPILWQRFLTTKSKLRKRLGRIVPRCLTKGALQNTCSKVFQLTSPNCFGEVALNMTVFFLALSMYDVYRPIRSKEPLCLREHFAIGPVIQF